MLAVQLLVVTITTGVGHGPRVVVSQIVLYPSPCLFPFLKIVIKAVVQPTSISIPLTHVGVGVAVGVMGKSEKRIGVRIPMNGGGVDEVDDGGIKFILGPSRTVLCSTGAVSRARGSGM